MSNKVVQFVVDLILYGILGFVIFMVNAFSVMNYDACPPNGCGNIGQVYSFFVLLASLPVGFVMITLGRLKHSKRLVRIGYLIPVIIGIIQQFLMVNRL